VAAAVLVAAGFALFGGPSAPPPISRGSAAPDFSLPGLAGESARTLSGLRGRVVLLNFWATWCKPCEDEMPAMQRLHAALAGSDFELLAVSVDTEEADVRTFRDRLGLSFPILLDPERRVSHQYQVFRYPETLLIDRDGVVVERYVGPRDWDDPLYLERIRALLSRVAGGAARPATRS
jgi:peroxiredoxin